MQTTTTATKSLNAPGASMDAGMEVLLIRVGGRSFGVPLAHVRYVAPMPSGFAGSGPDAEDYFLFEGEPVTYLSLWDHLRLKSEYLEYEEIHTLLPQRRQDHLDWMTSLENSVRTDNPFSKARNAYDCAFGKWFYAYHAKDRRLSLQLRQFEQPHAAIHALADKLLGMAEAGQRDAALRALDEARHTTLASLLALFDTVEELVVELRRRVAVIVADGEATCALGADGVRDIVSVPPERLQANKTMANQQLRQASSGLVILDDQTIAPLLNWRGLCGDREMPAAE